MSPTPGPSTLIETEEETMNAEKAREIAQSCQSAADSLMIDYENPVTRQIAILTLRLASRDLAQFADEHTLDFV